jgi:hypothetical protein
MVSGELQRLTVQGFIDSAASDAQTRSMWPVDPTEADVCANPSVEGDKSTTTTLYPNGAATEEGVVLKSLENIREPSLDPRVHLSERDRPNERDLDENLAQRFSHLVFGTAHEKDLEEEKDHEPIYVSY